MILCVGWQAVERLIFKKTNDKFLLPIVAKVTDFMTIRQYLTHLQELPKSVNSKYVNVVMEMDATIRA